MPAVDRRLLILSRSSNPHGGVDYIVADLCRELPKRGWDVTLGLAVGPTFNQVEPFLDVHGPLPVIPLDARVGTRHARVTSILDAISTVKPDVVLSMRIFDAYAAVAIAKRRHGPLRFAVGVRSYEPGYLADLRRWHDSVDLCVTSGELLATACRELASQEADRVVSIPGGVRPPRPGYTSTHTHSTLRLLYAGRLDSGQKRVLDMVELAAELDQRRTPFRLTIAGSGQMESELKERMQPYVERGDVQFCGWVDHDELYNSIYPNADLFVHFAAWEGVTIAPREAMAHGVVPVISEFTGLHSEGQFRDYVNSLTFPVGRPDVAAEKISLLHGDRELLTRLSSAASQSQTAKYTFDGAIDAWDAALRQCCAQPIKSGNVDSIPDRTSGRLDSLPLPAGVRSGLRRLLRKPVQHCDAGSEWPTSGDSISPDEDAMFHQFAQRVEEPC